MNIGYEEDSQTFHVLRHCGGLGIVAHAGMLTQHPNVGMSMISGLLIATHDGRELISRYQTIQDILLLNAGLQSMKDNTTELQQLSVECGLYGMLTLYNVKIVCLIQTQRIIDVHEPMEDIRLRFYQFLMNPFTDPGDAQKYRQQLAEFGKQIALKQ